MYYYFIFRYLEEDAGIAEVMAEKGLTKDSPTDMRKWRWQSPQARKSGKGKKDKLHKVQGQKSKKGKGSRKGKSKERSPEA